MITINVRNWLFHIGIFGMAFVGYWYSIDYSPFHWLSALRLWIGLMCGAFIIVYRNAEVKK